MRHVLRRPRTPALLLLGAVFVAGAHSAWAERSGGNGRARTAATQVAVALGATRQRIDGFGTSERSWIDPHLAHAFPLIPVPATAQSQILTALYQRLGLTRARDTLDNGVQSAAGAPLNFSGKPDAQIAYVKQARKYGLKTFFPSPVYMEGWMTEQDVGPFVDWAMQTIQHWRALGAEPLLYSPLNEPQINKDFSPQWMHDVVLQLGQRLKAGGFKTKLVIPDDENPTDAYRRAVAVLQDPRTRPYVGALAYHIYRNMGDVGKMRQLATQYHLPLWMTEFSATSYTSWSSSLDWGVKMHTLLTQGGVNAIDYLWGFFGNWVQTDTMLSITFENGQYRSFAPTPIYWITGQYSRFVRPGYVRVAADSSPSPLLVSAYKGPGRAVVVVVNPAASSQTLRVKVSGGKLKGVVRPVQSSASEQWKSLAPLTPRNGSFAATLPPQSITTYVAVR